MKLARRLNISFLAFLLLLSGIRYYNAENIQLSKSNEKNGAACYFEASSTDQVNIGESRASQFNICQIYNPDISKHFSESLSSFALNSWKFTKKYHYIRFPDSREYSLEISDIIYPSHFFL